MILFQVHRLVIVDDEKHVIGLVSLSDLFKFLVSKPETPSDYDCINSQYFGKFVQFLPIS